jgi:hypothetical protein
MTATAPPAGHNGPTQAQSQAVVSAIEAKMADLRSEAALYKNRCKPIHEAIADIIDDAVDTMGMDRKALKITVKQREFLRKMEKLENELDQTTQDALDRLQRDLGHFADSPLGRAAMEEAQKLGAKKATRAKGNGKRAAAEPEATEAIDDLGTSPANDDGGAQTTAPPAAE